MKKISALAALLLGIVPVVTITLATLDHVSDPAAAHAPSLLQFLFTAFASLSGIYSLALLCLAYALAHKVAGLKEEVDDLHLRQRELIHEDAELKNRNEVLSATREVALVLNKDVKFEKVLEEVLRIATYLVGARPPEEITIFVRDEKSREVRARARLTEKGFLFEDQLAREAVDKSHVNLVLDSGRTHVDAAADRVDITLPLAADREILGAMKVKPYLDGDREERAARLRTLHRNLEEFSRIVALAVKTPDLYTRTIQDGLTRLHTKRHFEEQLKSCFEQARREGEPLSLIFADIDHFKKVNDTYGHLTGDIVLRDVAATVKAGIRSYSSAYRYGGEEMVVILPRTPAKQALLAAERLRRKVESKTFYSDKRVPLKVTLSLGVAEFGPDVADANDLVRRADESVYQAKQSGRNQVCAWGGAPAVAPATEAPRRALAAGTRRGAP